MISYFLAKTCLERVTNTCFVQIWCCSRALLSVGNPCVRGLAGARFPAGPDISSCLSTVWALWAPRLKQLGFWCVAFLLAQKARRSSSVLDAKPCLFLCSFKVDSRLNREFFCAWGSAGRAGCCLSEKVEGRCVGGLRGGLGWASLAETAIAIKAI